MSIGLCKKDVTPLFENLYDLDEIKLHTAPFPV